MYSYNLLSAVSNMNDDEVMAMETAIPVYAAVYARKIQQKIELLEDAYRGQQFFKWLAEFKEDKSVDIEKAY